VSVSLRRRRRVGGVVRELNVTLPQDRVQDVEILSTMCREWVKEKVLTGEDPLD
jgi:hypothetical protein